MKARRRLFDIANLAERSILAYLNGKKNLNWAIGEIHVAELSYKTLKTYFLNLPKTYADNMQFQELEKICRKMVCFKHLIYQ